MSDATLQPRDRVTKNLAVDAGSNETSIQWTRRCGQNIFGFNPAKKLVSLYSTPVLTCRESTKDSKMMVIPLE